MFGVREAHGQFPGRHLRLIQSQANNPLSHIIADTVPHTAWSRAAIFQGVRPVRLIEVVSAIDGGAGDIDLLQRATHRRMGLLDQSDDLQFL